MSKVDKEAIRRFVIKQKVYQRRKTSVVVRLVEKRFGVTVSDRSLRRWVKRFKEQDWDFRDKSHRPKTIHKKLTPEIEEWIVGYRKKTPYEAKKVRHVLSEKKVFLSTSTVKRVIAKHCLQRESKMKGKRLKWVRWQRSTPNSLWQLDWTEEYDKTIRLAVEDDCSRYCLALQHWKSITTTKVTKLLDRLTAKYGKPRQILSDNHSVFGGTGSTSNQFDKWCKKRGIQHIRSGVNKPTTVGKLEKLHDTFNREISWYKNPEHWRHGYNTQRPHESLDMKTPAEVYNEWFRYLYFKRKWTKTLTKKNGHMS